MLNFPALAAVVMQLTRSMYAICGWNVNVSYHNNISSNHSIRVWYNNAYHGMYHMHVV